MILLILGGFMYYKNLPTERIVVEKIEICGENKVVVKGVCVCDEKSGYYPIIGAFGGPDHNVCNYCDADSVKSIGGIKVCDPEGLGGQREVKNNPKTNPSTDADEPSPAEAEEQCGNGQVLNRDSKCEPAPTPPPDEQA